MGGKNLSSSLSRITVRTPFSESFNPDFRGRGFSLNLTVREGRGDGVFRSLFRNPLSTSSNGRKEGGKSREFGNFI